MAVTDDPKVPEPEQFKSPVTLSIVHPVAADPPARSIFPLALTVKALAPVVWFVTENCE